MSEHTTSSSLAGTHYFSSQKPLTESTENAPSSCLTHVEKLAIEETQETDALLYPNYNFSLWGDDLKVIAPIDIVGHGDLHMLPPMESVTSELCRVSLHHGLQEEGISRDVQLESGNNDTVALGSSKDFPFRDHYTCTTQNSSSLEQSISLAYQKSAGPGRSNNGNMNCFNVERLEDRVMSPFGYNARSGDESCLVEENISTGSARTDDDKLDFLNSDKEQSCIMEACACNTFDGVEPCSAKEKTNMSSGRCDFDGKNHINEMRIEHRVQKTCTEESKSHNGNPSLDPKAGQTIIVSTDCGDLNCIDINKDDDSVMKFCNTNIREEADSPGHIVQCHLESQKALGMCDSSDDCFYVNKMVKDFDHGATEDTRFIIKDDKNSIANEGLSTNRDCVPKAPNHDGCDFSDSCLLKDEKNVSNPHSQVSLHDDRLNCLDVENSVTKIQQMNNGNSLNTDKNGEDSSVLVAEDHDDDYEDETEESESEEESSSSSISSSSEDSDDNSSVTPANHKKNHEMEVDSDFEEGELKESPCRLSKQMKSVKQKDDFCMDESSNDECGQKELVHSKREKGLPPVPKVSVMLEGHHKTLPIGIISSVLGTNLIVESTEGQPPLNEGSILWLTEKRLPLGIIDELFGPVKKPFYLVRYNVSEEIPEGAQEGVRVSFVQEFADFALNNPDIYSKGYDDLDGDLSDSEVEFSDDEKEAEYRRARTNVKREREKTEKENQCSDRRLQGHPHKKDSRVRDSQRKERFGWTSRDGYQQNPCDKMRSPKALGNQQNGYYDFFGRQPKKQLHHSPGESKQNPYARPNQRLHDSTGAVGRKQYQCYSGEMQQNSEAKDSPGLPVRRLYQSHSDEDKKANDVKTYQLHHDSNEHSLRIAHQPPCSENIQKPTAAAESLPVHQSQLQTLGRSHQLLQPSRQTSLCSDIPLLGNQGAHGVEVNGTHNVPRNSFQSSHSQLLSHLPLQNPWQAPRPTATGYGIPVGGPMLQPGISVANSSLPNQSGAPPVNLLHHQSGVSVAAQPSPQPNVEAVQGWPTSLRQTGMYVYPEPHSSFNSSQQPQGITQVPGLPPQTQIQAVNIGGYSVGVQAHAFGTPVIGIPAWSEAASFCHISQGSGNQDFLPSASNSSTIFQPGSSPWGTQDLLQQSYRPCMGPWQQHDSPCPRQHQRYAPRDRSRFQNKQNGPYQSRRF